MSSPTGLKMSGSLALGQKVLAKAQTGFGNIELDSSTSNRSTDVTEGSALYYIQADFDINSAISLVQSGTDGQDDVFQLDRINVEHSSAKNVAKNLPAGSADVPAGIIEAHDDAGHAGQFTVHLMAAVDKVGLMTSSFEVRGADVTGSLTDDSNKAQLAFWNCAGHTAPAAPAADDADVLSSTLTAAQVKSQYQSALTTINGNYNNKDMLESWTITIDEMKEASTDNALSKFIRKLRADDAANPSDSAPLKAGTKLITQSSKTYSVNIDDYEGNPVNVASGEVFGVLAQVA